MHRNFPVFLFLTLVFCVFIPVNSVFTEGNQGKPGNGSDTRTLKKDASDAFAQMDEAFKPSPADMTAEDEYYLGRAVAAQIIKTYKSYTANPALTSYLNKICQTITINSPKPTLFSGYHVEILDTNEICAFSSPGGHIFISRSLIDCASSEDALAAVIAHEVAHIQCRHVAAILANEHTVQELSAAANRAASIASRSLTAEERAVLFRQSLSVTVNTLFRDGYSREQEFEADRVALVLLKNAGYDPAALADFLKTLEKKSQTGNPPGSEAGISFQYMNRTHPAPAERIAKLGNIPGGSGHDTLSARKPRFDTYRK